MSIAIKPLKDCIAIKPHWVPANTTNDAPDDPDYNELCIGTVIATSAQAKHRLSKEHTLRNGDIVAYPTNMAHKVKIDGEEIHIISSINIIAIIYKNKIATKDKQILASE